MNLSINIFIGAVICLCFAITFFYIASKSPKEYVYVLLPVVFYFLGLGFIFFMVGTGYAYTSPANCEFKINDTHEDFNLTGHQQSISANHTDTTYHYLDVCLSEYDTTALENLYIILLWSFFFILLAGIITTVYLVYKWIGNIW